MLGAGEDHFGLAVVPSEVGVGAGEGDALLGHGVALAEADEARVEVEFFHFLALGVFEVAHLLGEHLGEAVADRILPGAVSGFLWVRR